MTNELQQNRYDRLVRRVGNMIGPGSKVPEVEPMVMPTLDVENVPGELLLLGDTRLAYGGGLVGPVVGQFPAAQVHNPPNSNTLITVTNCFVSSGSTLTLVWGVGGAPLIGQVQTQQFRDYRLLLPDLPVGQISEQAAGAVGVGTMFARLLADTTIQLTDPNGLAVLAPGTSFTIELDTTNSVLFYGFHWRERVAEESELRF